MNNLVGTNDSVASTFPAGQPNANGDIVGTGQQDDPARIDPVITGQNQNEAEAIPNYPLGSGSPAIDAGANTDLAGNEITLDGRGYIRPGTRSGDTTVDIGAYEFESRPAKDSLVVNELDAVTGTPDDQEFVEIKNIGMTTVQLADYALVFYDGAGDSPNTAYFSLNLEGELAPGAIQTVGNPNAQGVDQEFGGSESDITDSEGAVGLYRGNASDYPNGAEAGQNADTRADVLVYDNSGSGRPAAGGFRAFARGPGDNALCGAFGLSADCAVSGDDEDNSIQRNADGSFSSGSPSPGGDTVEDTTPPVCAQIVPIFEGPDNALSAIDTGASDPESGIATVEFIRLTNLDGFVDGNGPFAQGDVYDAGGASSIDVFAERISFSQGGALLFEATNGAGLTSLCDPVIEQVSASPEAFQLESVFPNPFTASAQVRFSVPDAREVSLEVYDVLGRRVVQLVEDRAFEPGTYDATLDGTGLAAGTYVLRLVSGSEVFTQRVTVVR